MNKRLGQTLSTLAILMLVTVSVSPDQRALANPIQAPAYAAASLANSVVVTTSPGKLGCSIRVLYKSGPSVAQGLTRKTSSAAGVVS
jgi:hypothetical protein